MNKRDFLKALVGMGSATALSPVAQAAPPESLTFRWPDEGQPKHYRGYRYHWTGLKSSQDHNWQVGQWLAWPLLGYGQPEFPNRQPYLYLNVPGFVGGVYYPGNVFNICGRGRIIDRHTPSDQIASWVDEGEQYLRQLIDGYVHVEPPEFGALYDFPLESGQTIPPTPHPPDCTFGFSGFIPAKGRG